VGTVDAPRLDRAAIESALLPGDSIWTAIEILEQTESTNADVATAARDGAAEGLIVTTEHQIAGRGRLGRSWASPPRSGLAVSVLMRPAAVPASRWPWLPLLAGVAVRESVVAVTGVDAVLKWPNDVLVVDRKLAGILVERIDSEVGAAAVVGIGLNVALDAGQLPTPEATSLLLCGATTDRTALLVDLLRRLESRYLAWVAGAGDPEALRAAYVSGCATVGQRVRVELPDGSTLVGRAVGIDAAGRLQIDTDGEQHAVGAGDVVHLRSGS
jgi:BirA family transcriptional regulator, biotin operon repressor / biotin---[acetyl-CoA-carboxylase] ligase